MACNLACDEGRRICPDGLTTEDRRGVIEVVGVRGVDGVLGSASGYSQKYRNSKDFTRAALPPSTFPRKISITSPIPPSSSNTLTLTGLSASVQSIVSIVSSASVGASSVAGSGRWEDAKSKGIFVRLGDAEMPSEVVSAGLERSGSAGASD